MAAPFSREVLERIVKDSQYERVKFKDGKTGVIDIVSASVVLQACDKRPDLERTVLETCRLRFGAFQNVVSLLLRK